MPGLMVSIAHDIIEPNANQPLEDFRKESGEIMKLTWRVRNHPLIEEELDKVSLHAPRIKKWWEMEMQITHLISRHCVCMDCYIT